MENVLATVGNADTIADVIAANPVFPDCEIASVELDRVGPSVLLVIDVPNRHGSNDVPVSKRIVRIRFIEITDFFLSDFNHQNVITGLHVTREGSPERLHVEVESVFGAVLSFRCGSASVI